MTALTAVAPLVTLYNGATWDDITAWLRGWSVRWGRRDEWGKPRARVLNLDLGNRAREFEPGYATSPYYPQWACGARVYFGLTYTYGATTVTRHLFCGQIDSIVPKYPGAATDSYVNAVASDHMSVLAKETTAAAIPSGTGDAMIHAVLGEMDYTFGFTEDLELSPSTLQAYTPSSESILSVVEKVTDSDYGAFWMEPGSQMVYAVYINRHHHALGWAPVAYFDNANTNGKIADLQLAADKDNAWTRASVTRVGGVTQTYEDTAASAAIGEYPTSRTGLLLNSDAECDDLARHLVQVGVASYALRPGQLTALLAVGDDHATHAAHAVQLATPFAPIQIAFTPTGGGATRTFDAIVQGGTVSQRAPKAPVEFVAYLAPRQGEVFWVLGDSDLSVLGSTTILGW